MTQTAPIPLTSSAWRKEAIACIVILLLGCTLRLVDLGGVRWRSPDERSYTRQAAEITAHGSEGVRQLAAQLRADHSLFEYPPPVRAGYLFLLSWMQQIFGGDAMTGAALSCIASIAALLLLGLIAWRHLSPRVAVYAMLLYAVSPPVLEMARRAWQESFVECAALLLLLFSLEAFADGHRRLWLVAAGLCAGLSITIKEVSLLHAALLLVLLSLALIDRARWPALLLLWGVTLFTAIACLAWLSSLVGGVAQVFYILRENAAVAAQTAYAVANQTGSPLTWLYALWVADPLLLSLAAVGIVAAVWRSSRPLQWSLAVAVLFTVLPALSAHRLNLRFACMIFAPLCLIAAATIDQAQRWLASASIFTEQAWVRRFAGAVLLCALAIDYLSFRERFVRTDLQDLSVHMVLDQPPPL